MLSLRNPLHIFVGIPGALYLRILPSHWPGNYASTHISINYFYDSIKPNRTRAQDGPLDPAVVMTDANIWPIHGRSCGSINWPKSKVSQVQMKTMQSHIIFKIWNQIRNRRFLFHI